MNRCLGTKRYNSPCTVTVENQPQTYCWWHDPAHAEQRKQAACRGGKRAGRGRPQTEIAEIKALLANLTARVLKEEGTENPLRPAPRPWRTSSQTRTSVPLR
jgi:hypothetical protein